MKKLILLLTIINTTFAADVTKEPREFCVKNCDPHGVITGARVKKSKQASDEGEMAWQDVQEYGVCLEKCQSTKQHVQGRIKELAVQPSISSLQKELSSCQYQLRIMEGQDPKVFNNLLRSAKEFEKIYHENNCDVGIIPRPGCDHRRATGK